MTKTTILFIVVACLHASCKKFVDIKPSPNIVPSRFVFQTDQTALAAASGVYVLVTGGPAIFSNSGLSRFAGLMADELAAPASSDLNDPFFFNSILQTNTTVNSTFYNPAYQIIYGATGVLEGLESSSALSPSLKKQLMGEMFVLRSLAYYYLVQLFGDVPLVLSTDYRTNAQLPRRSIENVLSQIVKDLTTAKDLLSVSYATTGKIRINRHAASVLLARIYLLQEKWTEAVAEAGEVIGSGMYQLNLSGNLTTVFGKNNGETIWEVASPNDISVPGDASQFLPALTTVLPNYTLSPYLLKDFEANDTRKNAWTGTSTVNGVQYFYPRKYRQQQSAGVSPNEYQIIFRYPEMFLLRAEAATHINQLTLATNDLNIIRLRAQLSSLPNNLTQDQLLEAVSQERRVEFFAEWGHRWLDLKRTGKIDQVLSAVKGNLWASTDALLPIPEAELLANPFLHQNPGY